MSHPGLQGERANKWLPVSANPHTCLQSLLAAEARNSDNDDNRQQIFICSCVPKHYAKCLI